MEKSAEETRQMCIRDRAKIAYEAKEYPVDENDLSGSHAADLMGVDHGSVFKTLVLRGEKTGYMVCCIPVDGEVVFVHRIFLCFIGDLRRIQKTHHIGLNQFLHIIIPSF